MILEQSFTKEHIESIRNLKVTDPMILERNIFALRLLEALRIVKLDFIFKGGTSLTLLLDEPSRLSTDIDIIVDPSTNIEEYIQAATKISPFTSSKKQERKGKNGIVKSHYKFTYFSPIANKESYILLDILFEKNNYTTLVHKPIKNSLLLTTQPYLEVITPSIDCIIGDKLTAFAPNTTGIPYNVGKDVEIIKQMYDVACAFDSFTSFKDIYDSYMNTCISEIGYRGNKIHPEDALMDTISTCACIASRGTIGNEYPALLSGIKGLRNHIYNGVLTAEIAVTLACKVMYIASCVLKNHEIEKLEDLSTYQLVDISKTQFPKLSNIRKTSPIGFAYVVESLKLLENNNIII